MDPVQITIIVISFVLTTLIVILTIQTIGIMKEFKLTVQKMNKMLDDGGKITGVVSDSATSIAGVLGGIKTGMNIFSMFRKKGESNE